MHSSNTNAFRISTSCVIPAYNATGTIARAVRSVLGTAGIGEVIVVDDGSCDDTPEQVKTIAENATIPVRLIEQQNAGAAAARNTGVDAVRLDWVTFLDADDEMLAQAITGKQNFLARCSNPGTIDGVHGSFVRGDTGAVGHFAESTVGVDPDGIGRAGGFPGGVVSYMFRREPLQATGGFRTDLLMYEDFELILRLIKGGARIVGCNVPGFHRHYMPNSLTRGTTLTRRLRIEQQFLAIAAQDKLMSGREIAHRRLRNRARQLFHIVTGR